MPQSTFEGIANDLYDAFLRNLPKLKTQINFLDPPPVSRLHKRNIIKKLTPYKDAISGYTATNHLQFILAEYEKTFRTLLADTDSTGDFKHLYVFKNLDGAEEFPERHTYISKEKATELFSNPRNRDFDHYSIKFIANQSEDDVIAFTKYLSSLAHDMRVINGDPVNFDPNVSYNLSRIYFLGPPGLGKTTFLNYMLSTRSDYFSEEKIIWVRLDFNLRRQKDFSKLSETIIERIMRIVSKYYIKKPSTGFSIRKIHLRNYMKTFYPEKDANVYVDRLLKLLPEKAILKEQLPEDFIYHFLSYLRANGWALLIVLDGADRISLEETDNEAFRRIANGLKATFYEKDFIKAVFILSLRYPSYKFLMDKYVDTWNQQDDPHMICYLYAKDIETILKLKLEHARKIVLERLKLKVSQAKDPSKYSIVSEEFLRGFEKHLLRITYKGLNLNENATSKEFFGIFGYNFRLLFRCLSRITAYFGWLIIDFAFSHGGLHVKDETELESLLNKKKYYVLKAYMMPADLRKDYHSTYSYDIEDDTIIYNRTGFGRALVPNIFNYIDAHTVTGKWSVRAIRTLIRYRCIEYVYIYDGQANLAELIQLFTMYYGFDENFVLAEIEELVCECLIVSADLRVPFRSDFVYQIKKEINIEKYHNEIFRITRLGKYLTSYVMKRFEYIAYIVNDTPIARDLVNKMHPINFYWEGVTASEALSKEIFNVLTFLYSYLHPIELSEDKIIQEAIAKFDGAEPFFEYFDVKSPIFETILGTIKPQIISMLMERLINAPTEFLESLENVLPNLKKDAILAAVDPKNWTGC